VADPIRAREPDLGTDRRESERVRLTRADWPRERLHRDGPRGLGEVDLLALVLRTGDRSRDARTLAFQLLAGCGSLAALAELSPRALEALPGVGPAKSASLAAALELGRRLVSIPLVRGQVIRSPDDVHRHFAPRFRGRPQESFHVVLLDARHRLMSIDEVSVGTLTASLVHPREVFREAIRQAAAALLLVHHHPSGDPSPSPEDRSVTERLAAGGRLLGIAVVDHVIVAEGGFFSFQQAGCLEPATSG
jgi:DNA repair protein RadC